MEKTHPFTLQNACRWCRKKNVPKSPRQLFLSLSQCSKNPRDARRFLKQTLKQLQDEVDCKEDNTL